MTAAGRARTRGPVGRSAVPVRKGLDIRQILPLAACALVSCGGGETPWITLTQAPQSESCDKHEHAIPTTSHESFKMVVEATIGHGEKQQQATMVVDTGAGATLLSQELRQALGLKVIKTDSATGFGGSANMGVAAVDYLSVGTARRNRLEVLFGISGDIPALEFAEIDGILGLNFLSSFDAVMLDYPRGLLKLIGDCETRLSFAFAGASVGPGGTVLIKLVVKNASSRAVRPLVIVVGDAEGEVAKGNTPELSPGQQVLITLEGTPKRAFDPNLEISYREIRPSEPTE